MRASLLLAALLLGPALVVAQTAPGRFPGWSELHDPQFRFDADERQVLSFSLQTPPSARAALAEAEKALAADDVQRAASLLLGLARNHGGSLIQVSEDESQGGGRWVGAGEWALYMLASRLPRSAIEAAATPEERERVAQAVRWRDSSALRGLSWSLDGLPQGATALAALARLWVEQGRDDGARVALSRLRSLGAPTPLSLAPPVTAPTPRCTVTAVTDGPLRADWALSDSSWLGQPFPITRLVELDRRRSHPFAGSSQSFEAPYSTVEPVVDDGVVYLADSVSVVALDLLSGRTLWHHAGPLEEVDAAGVWGEQFDLGIYATSNRRRAISPYQVVRPVLAGARLLAVVQAAEAWHDLDEFDGHPINHPLPRRRLRCLDPQSGALLWRQERPELGEEAFQNRLDVHGPPVLSGGLAYVAGSITEGAINAYAAAFELESGDLVWHTLLCTGQQELTMFNRPFQEHVLAPPGLYDGSLLVNTNLGVVASLDAWSGRLRWVSSYPAMERHSARSTIRPSVTRSVHWTPAAPFVEDGMLVVAPLDSEWMLGLDPNTGQRRWRAHTYLDRVQRPPLRHQALPTGDGRVILVNDQGSECINAASGVTVWSQRPFGPHDRLSGAAVLSGGHLLVPADPWLVIVDADDGQMLGSRPLPEVPRGLAVQRVVPAGPALLMVDGTSVFAHLDPAALLREHGPLADSVPRSNLALAELCLAGGRFDEATRRFSEVAAAGGAGLVHRARTGLVASALARARWEDTPRAWAAVLELAPGRDERLALADEALLALDRLGAQPELVHWLGQIAQLDPEHPVSLPGEPTREAQLAYGLRRLPLETPAQQVALLQGLIASGARGSWDGLPVSEAARRRIDELLAEHGRSLYAPFELQAAELHRSGLSLDAVARLHPNAELVLTLRIERLAELLTQGEARLVFEQTAGARSPELLALRAVAARQLGERSYADALEGRAPTSEPRLPSLPPDGSGSVTLTIHPERDVRFRDVAGQPSQHYAGVAVGCVDGVGELFCVDTRAGRVLWSGRALPGGTRSFVAGVDVHLHDDVLLVRGRNEILALSLDEGLPRWSRTLVGSVFDQVGAQGLLVTLLESSLGDLRIEAHGMATGLPAFRIDLPGVEQAQLHRVGQQVLALTTGVYQRDGQGRDKRLLVLDLARGELASSTPVRDRQEVVTVSHDPPLVFLKERMGTGSVLAGWSPESRQELWSLSLDSSSPSQRHLFSTAGGRAVLREPAALPGSTSRDRDLLTLLDTLAGPLPGQQPGRLLRMLDTSGSTAPRIVLIDPSDGRRLSVLDGTDLSELAQFTVEGPALPLGATSVLHGRDGFVIQTSTLEPPGARLVMARGPHAEQRYSMDLGDLRRPGLQIMLVEGAVVLGSGGKVRVLRSATP